MSFDEADDFEPLVVLQLSPTTPAITKEWIIHRLTASHNEDEGAGLLARFERGTESRVSRTKTICYLKLCHFTVSAEQFDCHRCN